MKKRKGIVLAGGAGSRLHPLTLAMSKQMMPVYDKPMIYYPISVLMLAGIREILIISTPQDLPLFKRLLGTGEYLGVSFFYEEQPKPEGLAQAFLIGEKFLDDSPAALILGDNLFYGQDFQHLVKEANEAIETSTIFAYHVSNPKAYGVIEFDYDGKAISIEEKPRAPKSNYAVPGIYFYDDQVVQHAKSLKPSARGELEITDLNLIYLQRKELMVKVIGRGTAWLDTGTHKSLLEASHFVQTIQSRQGLQVACLEEIAFNKGWVDEKQISKSIHSMGKSSYATYLESLLQE
ncbi:MAG: glucose-1-phosphate thymidylyltransferase RfbA [Verrucomicrobiota bacterium]